MLYEGVLQNGVTQPQILNLDGSGQHQATACLHRNRSLLPFWSGSCLGIKTEMDSYENRKIY